jgi:hypothetical protein
MVTVNIAPSVAALGIAPRDLLHSEGTCYVVLLPDVQPGLMFQIEGNGFAFSAGIRDRAERQERFDTRSSGGARTTDARVRCCERVAVERASFEVSIRLWPFTVASAR